MLISEKEFFEGRTVKIKEEEWIIIKYFGYGLFLAVRSDDEFPKQAYLVREDEETIEGG